MTELDLPLRRAAETPPEAPLDAPPLDWRAMLSGLCACLVGVGFGRFAYTPLVPALIAAGWVDPPRAGYLGAANFMGYLIGAALYRPVTARLGAVPALRAMTVLVTVSLFACAAPVSLVWLGFWRFVAGLAGGVMMVLAAPVVLARVTPRHRGFVAGVVLTGVGIGIVASGTLIPILLKFGLARAWQGLGLAALALTALAWSGWPRIAVPRAVAPAAKTTPRDRRLIALYAEYALDAFGVVPHMVFLVDYVARGLGLGMAMGATCWVAFGLGATAGPTPLGALADRIGFRATVRLAYVAQAACLLLVVVSHAPAALLVSSVVIGALVPGIAPLTLGRVRNLVPDASTSAHYWSVSIIMFAIGQVVGALVLSMVFQHLRDHAPLFALGALAFAAALGINLVAGGGRAEDPPARVRG